MVVVIVKSLWRWNSRKSSSHTISNVTDKRHKFSVSYILRFSIFKDIKVSNEFRKIFKKQTEQKSYSTATLQCGFSLKEKSFFLNRSLALAHHKAPIERWAKRVLSCWCNAEHVPLFRVKMHCLIRKQKNATGTDAPNNILGLKNYATCVQIDLGGTVNW